MNRRIVFRSLAVSTAVFAITAGFTSLGGAPVSAQSSASSSTPSSCHSYRNPRCFGVLFDDFNYTSLNDPAVALHGWAARSGTGGPGVSGARWSPGDISFPNVDGQKSLQLQLTTNGTAKGTTESEFYQTGFSVREGTYLARIKFSDTPASGPDGDLINQTFFAISNPSVACDPTYSETDFSEYLPNGVRPGGKPLNTETTWHAAPGCKLASVEGLQHVSLNGWHTIMATVSGGHVRYYVDGRLVADASKPYYPIEDMRVDFNTWLMNVKGHTGSGTSVWHEDVNYVYYAQNCVLTQKQILQQVRFFRRHHVHFLDTVRTN